MEFSCKFVIKFCKKRLFFTICPKSFNSHIFSLWITTFYKIIKFASNFYKILCEKCFVQNILQK